MSARFITLTRPGDNTSVVVNVKHIERVTHPVSSAMQGNAIVCMISGDNFGVSEDVPEILDLLEALPYK